MFNKKIEKENKLLKKLVKQQEMIINMYRNNKPIGCGIMIDTELIELKNKVLKEKI